MKISISHKILGLDAYSYGFQGQERDDEVKGSGNSYAFEYRMHDSRLGRFLSRDPLALEYPHNSPYAFSENDVVRAIELEGAEKLIVTIDLNTGKSTTLEQPIAGPLGDGVLYKTVGKGETSYTYQSSLIIHSDGTKTEGKQYSVPRTMFENEFKATASSGAIKQYETNIVQDINKKLNSESDGTAEATGKFLGRIVYNTADDFAVGITSFALFRDIVGLQSPINLDGTAVQDYEDRAAHLVSAATFAFPMKSITKGLTIRNFSQNAANRSKGFSQSSYQNKLKDLWKTNNATTDAKNAVKSAKMAEEGGAAADLERDEQ